MARFSLDRLAFYTDLTSHFDWRGVDELVRACTELQRAAGARFFERRFQPDRTDGRPVSAEALGEVLEEKSDVGGVSSERQITNAIPFNMGNVTGFVGDRKLRRLRRQLSTEITRRIRALFQPRDRPILESFGTFWYPPASYMGWHTNSGYPGWRLYVSYAEEAERSFFRFRHPHTHEIITSYDTGLNARIFRISDTELLWHAVYSRTHRFSLGSRVYPWSPTRALNGFARSTLSALAPHR